MKVSLMTLVVLLCFQLIAPGIGGTTSAHAYQNRKTPTTIRLYNHSDYDLEEVTLAYLNDKFEFGNLPAASASHYIEVEAAYPVANVTGKIQDDLATTIDDDPLVAQPYDFIGVEALRPGQYTYQIDVNAEFGVLEITLMEPVVEMEMTGGLCEFGECYSQVIVYPEGTVIIFIGSGDRFVVEIDPELVTETQEAIAAVDIIALRTLPAIGTCSEFHDEMAYHYTFKYEDILDTFSTCEVEIDFTQAPFSNFQTLWDTIVPLWTAAVEVEKQTQPVEPNS